MAFEELNINVGLLLFLVCIALVIIYAIVKLVSFRSLPPGPWGFPLFGCLPRLGRKPHLTVQTWWHRYGDIVSLKLGSHFCIIINGIEAMQECLVRQQHVFAGRPWNNFRKLTKNKGRFAISLTYTSNNIFDIGMH